MMLSGARILVLSGIVLFGLRGVLDVLAPDELLLLLTVLLAGATAAVASDAMRDRCPIGELGCRQGLLTPSLVSRILRIQKTTGGRFGEIAVQENYLTTKELLLLLDLQDD